MARAIIVGGGAFDPKLLPERGKDDLLIAADSGYRRLAAAGVTPDLCIGDWDSLGEAPQDCEVVTLPVAKDDTDLVAAARLGLARGCTEFVLLGALGGRRFSHSLAAVQTMHFLALQGAACTLLDADCTMTVLRGRSLSFPAAARGSLSVLALTDRAVVTLEGLWYSAEHLELTNRFPLGVSNAFLGKAARVCAEQGVVLVIEEAD
jgi:thiamine pyrophosphokinase